MAYIIGLASPEEVVELKRRGWEVEDGPAELLDPDVERTHRFIQIWVDSSILDVMTGPAWEGSYPDEPTDRAARMEFIMETAEELGNLFYNGDKLAVLDVLSRLSPRIALAVLATTTGNPDQNVPGTLSSYLREQACC